MHKWLRQRQMRTMKLRQRGRRRQRKRWRPKKQELRDSRVNDTAYVVHCARIECPFGMRESYLALDATHGVLTHQIPQMTVKDMILNTNIINFGGCHSRENP